MAVGGQGAPLSAFVDHCLFASAAASRAVQNIGGIANVTHLPKGCGLTNVIAFDTGPGNMVIDGIVRLLTHGAYSFDDGGAWAAEGSPALMLLEDLMRHPYVGESIPKTSGREDFGDFFAKEVLEKAKSSDVADADLVATVTAFTAETIRHHYARYLEPLGGVDEMIVYGGGAHNQTLMRYIRERLPHVAVRFQDEFGIAGDARESVTWAVLADETLGGHAANVPSASGAQRRVRLGRIIDIETR
jgi:anhydro-N-acetylmuramic acid kinase